MIRTIVCGLLLAFALPGMAAQPEAFRFSKEVARGESKKEAILAVTFDGDVYAATQPEFPDLRIFGPDNKEVPCLVERATEAQMHTVCARCEFKVASLKEHDDALDVFLRLDADSPPADIVDIVTPLTNYERRVRVFGSNDGEKWTELVANGLVFDYSRYMDIQNQRIRLPKNTYRQLKVNITGIADAKESPFLELTRKYQAKSEVERIETTMLERRPFRMDRIELWHERTEKLSQRDRTAEYKVVKYHVEENAKDKTTVVNIVTRREPLTQFTLETSSRNFSRSLAVQVPMKRGDATIWRDIAQGTVSVVDFSGYRRQQLDVSFPEQRQTEYRIVIRNDDNPPLAITGVKAFGNVYQAVFLAAEGQPYRLCYGSEQTERPKYDAATVLGPLRERQDAVQTKLGGEVANPTVVESHAPVSPLRILLNNPVILGTAVVVLVALLGWALFCAVRRINEIPKE